MLFQNPDWVIMKRQLSASQNQLKFRANATDPKFIHRPHFGGPQVKCWTCLEGSLHELNEDALLTYTRINAANDIIKCRNNKYSHGLCLLVENVDFMFKKTKEGTLKDLPISIYTAELLALLGPNSYPE
jgi:hypothetical protein